MANPFLAEVRPFAFNFAPLHWAFCDGTILPISDNTALFSLLGTSYGGNGTQKLALPNLQSRVPIHTDQYSAGGQYPLGSQGGVETVTLSLAQFPAHRHNFLGTTAAADEKRPVTGSAYAASAAAGSPPVSPDQSYYGPAASLISINPYTLAFAVGDGQPHENLQPFVAINWCIALAGVYPARN